MIVRKKCIFIFLMILSFNLQARNPREIFREIERECFNVSQIRNLSCEFYNLEDASGEVRERYRRGSWRENVVDEVYNQRSSTPVITRLYRAETRRTRRNCRRGANGFMICPDGNTPVSEFYTFLNLLKNKVDLLEPLVPSRYRPFFRAYAAKCASSLAISYNAREDYDFFDFLNDRYFSNVAEIWYGGVGECSEQSTLASEISRYLGVRSRNVTTLRHEFNEVRVSGRYYYMDAQSPACTFMIP